MAGKNWFLIVVCVVAVPLVFIANLYVLVNFQHAEDRNQAYLPKVIVVTGLSIAIFQVLMFPLDVSNRSACSQNVVASACDFTLPMEQLWHFVHMTTALYVFIVIPFAMFFYEADSELTMRGKLLSATKMVSMSFTVLALVLGIAYGLAGFVDYEVERLESGLVPLGRSLDGVSSCILPDAGAIGGLLCDAIATQAKETWSMRTSFPVYVAAITSIIGWLLFMVFAGVGAVALPLDWIHAFVNRPRTWMTRSEYIKEAGVLGKRATDIKRAATALRQEEMNNGRTRKWRKDMAAVSQAMSLLEEDEDRLLECYPQGEDADVSWTFTVMSYWAKLVGGVVSTIATMLWVVHIILYVFSDPPVHPFLNDLFVELDKAFPLFGIAAFALFCFYLIIIVMKGNMKLGLCLVVFTIHPMRLGNTLMSSFLFNTALIMVCSVAVIQFCATAFAVYANETDIQRIFGDEIENLRGIKYLYKVRE